MKSALIIGITGQDGSYLTELLLEKGYAVHGLVRRASMFNRSRIDPVRLAEAAGADRLRLHYGELHDMTSFRRLLRTIKPDEIYHLAGQSHVGLSFEIPEVTCLENGMATLNLLESLRDMETPARFYNASSSEIYGAPATAPQDESTKIDPINPYGCAKAFATQLARVYRASYGLFVCNGITYNHESPRRGENFVTRKITLAAARIQAGRQDKLSLGNLDAQRDWGYAAEYVDAIWRMLQAPAADDYVVATGRACSVREFAAAAFSALGIDVVFEGSGAQEVGRRRDTGAIVIEVDPRYFRPVDSTTLLGRADRAREKLGWTARTIAGDVARLMAAADAATLAAR